MAIYRVFVSPFDRTGSTVIVKEGYCWSAMVFSAFWAIWHRMWIVAILLLAGLLLVRFLALQLDLGENLQSLVSMAVAFILGNEAEHLRAWSLERAGYREIGVVEAHNLDEAELKYFLANRQPPGPAAVNETPRPQLAADDTLGLFGTA